MSRVAGAAEIVLSEPGAWLVSAAGFLARGGVILFLVALLELPSPITLTLVFGVDSVTATGEPTARLIVTIAALIGLGAIAVVAMLLTAAWSDVISIDRVRSAPSRSAWATAADVLGVSWLQSLGLLPGILALALIAPMLRDVAVGEVLLPSSFSIPYLLRVFADVSAPLGRALLVLAAGELLVTIATRRYLATVGNRSTLRAYGEALAEIVRRPTAIASAWLVGLAVLLVAAVMALWAVSTAWGEVRGFFLDISFATRGPLPGCGEGAACGPLPSSIAGVPLDVLVGAAGGAALLAVVWTGALALVGIASAFRSALWTLTIGSEEPSGVDVAWRADAHP